MQVKTKTKASPEVQGLIPVRTDIKVGKELSQYVTDLKQSTSDTIEGLYNQITGLLGNTGSQEMVNEMASDV